MLCKAAGHAQPLGGTRPQHGSMSFSDWAAKPLLKAEVYRIRTPKSADEE